MSSPNWEKYHDWVLGPIDVDWINGNIEIHLSMERKEIICVNNFLNISIPRYLAWGKSYYVNNIHCHEASDVGWNVEIELQSGDVLKIDGESINVRNE